MKNRNSEILFFLGSKDPLIVLKKWLKAAQKIPRLKEPWAMCLSTVSSKKKSQSRIVLLKKLEKNQLLFFTNYLSPKAKDLKKNPEASVVFFWPQIQKQIRISGPVKKTSRKISCNYWKKRSRNSQLSQYISQQSQEIKDRNS
ncbi:MAG: pyridoxal 5'-phosphate synthase [Bdellovibrionales bacterium]